MQDNVDVVVIGAGVIGCAVALELAREGRQVLVIDRHAGPGLGSTSASSAIVRYHYDHHDEAVLAWEAGRRWMDWPRYLGTVDPQGMAEFVRCGALVLDGALMDREAPLAHLRTLGIAVEELTAEEVASRFPAIDPSRLGPPTRTDDEQFWAEPTGTIGAFWTPDAGYVSDPQLAAANLAHAAASVGVEFRFATEVRGVGRDDGRVCSLSIATSDGRTTEIHPRTVVNAAGPWSSALNRMAEVLDDFNTSTRPLMQEVISLPAPQGFGIDDGGTSVTDPDFATYFRAHGAHTLLVGGMEPPCDPLVHLDSPDDAVEQVSAETWELQSLRLARRMPSATIPSQPRGIVGVYDVTEDWIPIYDRTSLDGWFVAIGTSGHGFKQAPFVGELIAALVQAVEAGHDHDADPIEVPASWTGNTVRMAHFSRRRHVVPQYGMG